MIGSFLEQLAARQDLTRAEAATLAGLFLDDDITDAQVGAALMALAIKGETADELAGFAETMRAQALPVRTRHRVFLDTAGTGGDGSHTFNISTATAFVIAAAGLPVAKHGNRAASSRSGSADVLAALGADIEAPPQRAAECLDDLGICFLFAPYYHAATRRVAAVRRQLGIRTAFNLLGPLTNPAGAPRQLIGVGNEQAIERVAHAAAALGIDRAWVVHGDGLDEITITGTTRVAEVRDGSFKGTFDLHPSDAGLPVSSRDDLHGGDPDTNAAIVQAILQGERRDGARDIVLLNAAAGLVIGDVAATLADGVDRAAHAVDSGTAAALLETFCQVRHQKNP